MPTPHQTRRPELLLIALGCFFLGLIVGASSQLFNDESLPLDSGESRLVESLSHEENTTPGTDSSNSLGRDTDSREEIGRSPEREPQSRPRDDIPWQELTHDLRSATIQQKLGTLFDKRSFRHQTIYQALVQFFFDPDSLFTTKDWILILVERLLQSALPENIQRSGAKLEYALEGPDSNRVIIEWTRWDNGDASAHLTVELPDLSVTPFDHDGVDDPSDHAWMRGAKVEVILERADQQLTTIQAALSARRFPGPVDHLEYSFRYDPESQRYSLRQGPYWGQTRTTLLDESKLGRITASADRLLFLALALAQ